MNYAALTEADLALAWCPATMDEYWQACLEGIPGIEEMPDAVKDALLAGYHLGWANAAISLGEVAKRRQVQS